jgi:hypothetical protein
MTLTSRDAQTTLSLDVRDRIRVVERSMAYYDDRLDRERVADLAGRHLPAVQTAVEKTISWGRDPETYLERVFGETFRGDLAAGERADAPAMVVLPRNDRGDLAPYVLAQCLLAGRPYVVRPSSREAGTYVARTYHDCLEEAARDLLGDESADAFASAFDLLDPEDAGASDLASLVPERVQLVLFGDDATLSSLEAEFADAGVEVTTTVRMGSGRSSSVLAPTAADSLEATCRKIARSAAFDKGDDCTGTSVCYVLGDREFYADALAELSAAANDLTVGEDFARPADEQLVAAREQLRAVHPGETLAEEGVTVVECTATAPVREFPVPLVQVKRAGDRQRLREQMQADFADRGSLVTSVFADAATFESLEGLPTELLRHGRPTHDVDLLEPHQGHYLVADLC